MAFKVGSEFAAKLSEALGVPLSHWAPFTSDGHLVQAAQPKPPPEKSKQPTLHPVNPFDYRLIPDWGVVSAGPPSDPGGDAAMVPVIDLPKEGEFISLVVRGVSMAPRIPDGARIIVRIQPGAESGETVIAWIEDGWAGGLVLKKAKWNAKSKRMELHSESGGGKAIPFDTARIVGVLKSYQVNVVN